jgi:hypothetical protein
LTYPSEKYEFVSWDDDTPNIWKNQIHVPKNQPDTYSILFPYAPCMDYYGIFINIYPKHHPNVNRSYMEHLGLMGKSKWEI